MLLEAEDIDRTRIFLTSRWTTDLTGPELVRNFLPALIQAGEKDLACRLLTVILDYSWVQRAGKQVAEPLVSSFWLKEGLNRSLGEVARLVPLEAARIAIDRIDSIVEKEPLSFYIGWIPSIEEPFSEHEKDRYENILVWVARECLIAASRVDPDGTIALVERILAKELPIFKRIALYVIAKEWQHLSPAFWACVSQSLLTEPFVGPELRQLSELHFHSFAEQQKAQWLDWIESASYPLPEHVIGKPDLELRHTAGQKVDWLGPLRGSGHEPALEMFKRYRRIAQRDPIELSPVGTVRTVDMKDETTVASERLARLDARAIAEALKEPTSSTLRIDTWSQEAALKRAVEEDSHKFDSDLSTFLELGPGYVHAVLWGLTDAWKAGGGIEWESVLDFCESVVREEKFWHPTTEGGSAERMQIVSQVADLITAGTREDSHAFGPHLLPVAEGILLFILTRTHPGLPEGLKLSSAVLNSPFGAVLRALINYSLRVARLNKELPEKRRWVDAIREEFTRRLDRSRYDSIEFSVTLGQYLPNLYHLDRSWVEENVDIIFPVESDEHWGAAFGGYLVSSTVYNEIYELLRRHGHYDKGLVTPLHDRDLDRRLVQHLCIKYLEGREPLGDPESLFERLISAWDATRIDDVVTYFWMQRERPDAGDREKIIALWERIAIHYLHKEGLSEEEQLLVSNLLRLTPFLELIDDASLERLRFSLPYIEKGHNTSFLVEYLRPLADVSPSTVTAIYLQMFDYGIYPDFDKAHIVATVEALYQAGHQLGGDSISRSYLMRGYDFLQDVYSRHQAPVT